jgi:hypothetical protein
MMFRESILSLYKKILRRLKYVLLLPHKLYHGARDFRRYIDRIELYKPLLEAFPKPEKGSVLIISGRGMNVTWAEMWPILGLAPRSLGYKGIILTTRAQKHLNRYYGLLDYELLFYEDLAKEVTMQLPQPLAEQVDAAVTLDDFRGLHYENGPVGEIALSTASRYQLSGIIDVADSKTRKEVVRWIGVVCQAMRIARLVYQRCNVRIVYINELFFEEYAGFYYQALREQLNIVKFTGTVRDKAFLIHHMSVKNDRLHHAALAESTWDRVKVLPYINVEKELTQNFEDRYGDKWFRSARNHKGTRRMEISEARHRLGVAPGRKVAVIFSHILYDTLFFFGTDLFDCHADWLIETVRAARENSDVDWLIKVHPSNIWRGELTVGHKNSYEEERLIQKHFGVLPPHVRVVPADNGINPYTWFQMADFCVTVRGTSGLEMATMGKVVVVAGTGRYENLGFTVTPPTRTAYLETLGRLASLPATTEEQRMLACRYAHALFVLKPIEFDFFDYQLRSGKKRVMASDDVTYYPVEPTGANALQGNLQRIADWLPRVDDVELLSESFG